MAKKPKNVARKHRHWQRWLKLTLVAVFGFIIFNLATNLAICWSINQQKPVEAILVLKARKTPVFYYYLNGQKRQKLTSG